MRKGREALRRADVLLLIGVVGASLLIWLFMRLSAPTAQRVVVTVAGEAVFEAALGQPGEYVLDDARGYNRVIIENGAARMDAANCPDQLCVLQGALSRTGEAIVCLPNRVVVSVTGGEGDADRVDAISR